MMKSRKRKIKKDKDRNKVSYSLECSFLENRSINSAFLKIVAVLVVISINGTGLLAIGKTFAYFNDTENSLGNTYTAGTLDFSLIDEGTSGFDIMSSGTAIRRFDIASGGSLPFQYIVRSDNLSGDLCDSLEIKAILDGDIKQEGALNGFYLDPSIVFSESLDEWQFDIEFSGDPSEHENESCSFNLVYEGWLMDVGSYIASGFKDTEQESTQITLLPEPIPDPEPDVYGCTDSFVFNYNPLATIDDGSCLTEPITPG